MEYLLTNYSVSEILLMIFSIALAIKGLVDLIDWFISKFNKGYNNKRKKEKMKDKVEWGINQINGLETKVSQLDQKIDLLILSDKDDIKSFLTRQYHHFMKQGWIDDYSLDCCEKRYSHYRTEGGNSFAETLMQALRSLPRQPQDKKD